MPSGCGALRSCTSDAWVSSGSATVTWHSRSPSVSTWRRAFGLTAFYHRYFSHRAFKTSRSFQFLVVLLGCTAMQKGPLWWAAHHRDHHRYADREPDVHSPRVHGFSWAHMGWFLTPANNKLRASLVRDWLKFPELKHLDRAAPLVALAFAAGLYAFGELLRRVAPALKTDGPQLLIWCFFISTVFLYHVTYSVNSLAHLVGSRRFETGDDSRNNLLVALLALGEGWHNNHHHYPASARQGFYWWEVDFTFYALLGARAARAGLGLEGSARPRAQPGPAARPRLRLLRRRRDSTL